MGAECTEYLGELEGYYKYSFAMPVEKSTNSGKGSTYKFFLFVLV